LEWKNIEYYVKARPTKEQEQNIVAKDNRDKEQIKKQTDLEQPLTA